MSGICAIVHLNGAPAEAREIDAMIQAGTHRARDGSATWLGEAAALGHLALHVTPEDEVERQPLSSDDGRYVIAADGRVDNRDELIGKLGGRRALRADEPGTARLLLEAYLRWGDDCMAHVIGDFAFVIHDVEHRSIFAARDPMSMRPLYYRIETGRVIVASEVKQILAVPGVPKRLHEPMAAAWLMVQPGDPSWTFYEGIQALPGGHVLRSSADGLSARRAWDFDPDYRIRHRSDGEYAEHFRQILLEAARCRMRSRHPAGIFLSGGLDSVSAAAASGHVLRHDPPDPAWPSMTAYAYRYEHFPECDERHVSAPLAAHFGFAHEEVSSTIMHEHPVLDGPWVDDGPGVGMYRSLHNEVLERARSAGVRQMYTGARGDNMMGAFIFDHLGLLLSGAVTEAWAEMSRYREAYAISTLQACRRTFVRGAVAELEARSGAIRRLLSVKRSVNGRAASCSRIPEWVRTDFLARVGFRDRLAESQLDTSGWHGPREDRYRAIHDGFTLLGNVFSAQNYARHQLQYEDVWGDRRIASFVLAVPQHVLNRTNAPKRLARLALKPILPTPVREASRKIIPAREGDLALRRNAQAVLGASRATWLSRLGLVDASALEHHVDTFLADGALESAAWSALTLERWIQSESE